MKSLQATSTKFLSQIDRSDIFEKSLKDLNVVSNAQDSDLETELGTTEDLLSNATSEMQDFKDGMTDPDAKSSS